MIGLGMSGKKAPKKQRWTRRQWLRLRYWLRRAAVWLVSLIILVVLLFSVVNPPTTMTMLSETRRLGRVDQEWVPIEEIAPGHAPVGRGGRGCQFLPALGL